MSDVIAELRWRGLLQDMSEGAEAHLASGSRVCYAGFDPTASSLHVGTLLPIMGLVHLQRHGHHPIPLVGGGTGLIGDPSGKAEERPLISSETASVNAEAIQVQLEHFLDFGVPEESGSYVQQLRVAERDSYGGLPARHREALSGERHDAQGIGCVGVWMPKTQASAIPSSATCSSSRTTSSNSSGARDARCSWVGATSGATSPQGST